MRLRDFFEGAALSGLSICAFSFSVGCHSGGTTGGGGHTTASTAAIMMTSTTDTTSVSGTTSSGGMCSKLPPSGFVNIAQGANVGYDLALTTDENGAPIVAWSEGPLMMPVTIWVKRWDACTGAWGQQLKVDGGFRQTTNSSPTPVSHNVALAYDHSNGTIGVAYQTEDPTDFHLEIRYAELPKGATGFATSPAVAAQMPNSGSYGLYSPGLALTGGTAHLFYQVSTALCGGTCPGLVYRTRTAGTWTSEMVVPNSQGGNDVFGVTSVQLDSAGIPGVAFQAMPDPDTTHYVEYWHPGMAMAAVVMKKAQTDDEPGVALTFDGTKPRIAATLLDFLNPPGLWFSSSDDGTTWTAPTGIETDGAFASMWVAIAMSSSGETAIVSTDQGADPGQPAATCGDPKISRSTMIPTFKTSCPAKSEFNTNYEYVQAAYGLDNKLQMAFRLPMTDAASGLSGGVIYWRDK